MNTIIVGLGSMGCRRARLIKKMDKSINIIGIDSNQERREKAEAELGIVTEDSIGKACEKYECEAAIISTSPLSHSSIINECLKNNLHVFTELNLVDDGYDENIELAARMKKVLFLSSTFMYRKEVEYIKGEALKHSKPISYIYHVGQYLPDWHPWESYKNFFVGDKRTNGCRELMAIEFPWLVDVFGDIRSYKWVKSKNSTLDIDYADSFQILFQHENGNKGMVEIDVISRKAERRFEMFGEDVFVTWDGTPETLFKYDISKKESEKVNLYDEYSRKEGYASFIIEDAYYNELVNFFDSIRGKDSPKYSFEKDKEIINMINKIEEDDND